MQDQQRTDNLHGTFADGELLNPAAYIKRIVCRMCLSIAVLTFLAVLER